jgi:hypothetical protein
MNCGGVMSQENNIVEALQPTELSLAKQLVKLKT